MEEMKEINAIVERKSEVYFNKRQKGFFKEMFEHILEHPEIDWDWCNISRHPYITWDTIQANPDKPWNWGGISENPNITWDIIQENPNIPWDLFGISRNKMNEPVFRSEFKRNIKRSLIIKQDLMKFVMHPENLFKFGRRWYDNETESLTKEDIIVKRLHDLFEEEF